MLELRPVCENCGKKLPNESTEAMICTYECTFCSDCVSNVLYDVCPNCGGGFEKRPHRPRLQLTRHPAKKEEFIKPVDMDKFQLLLMKNRNTRPEER